MQSDRIEAERRDGTNLRSSVVISDHQWSFWGNQWHSVGRSGGIRAYVKGERLVGRGCVQTIRPVGLVEPARKEDGAAVELRARDGVHGAQVPVGSEAPS